jgi:hypothetical protein
MIIFGLFFYCLVSAVASIGSDRQNPNRPEGEAELASFLSVLVLCLLVGVFLGTQSEQQPSVAEETTEQQESHTTDESPTEEDTEQTLDEGGEDRF